MNNDRIFIKGREIVSKTQHDNDLQNSQEVFIIDSDKLGVITDQHQRLADKLIANEPVYTLLKSQYFKGFYHISEYAVNDTSVNLTFLGMPNTGGTSEKNGLQVRNIRVYNITFKLDEQKKIWQITSSSGSIGYVISEYNRMVGKSYVDDAIATAIGNVSSFSLLPVDALPTENIQTNVIYAVPSENPEEQDVRIEYVYINDNWEKIGTTQIDLSNYYTKEEIDGIVEELRSLVQFATSEDIQNIVSPQPEEGGIDEGVELS